MNATQLPVYQKAIEIFQISRAISSYFSDDKHIIEMETSQIESDKYAGKIVMDSLQLAPSIASAISARNKKLRRKRIEKTKKVVARLQSTCKRLELHHLKGSEFLELLRKEIYLFERLINDLPPKD
ncbi:hypothetical protein [Zunongwangia sp.]|uniref:hypothetical protein n=1 Tax=Zunongwangia sp. TaxID=1965325 RepID=UPI003AA814F4